MTDGQPPIVIRETSEGDLPALVALWNDGRIMRWVGYPDGLGIDEHGARAWFDQQRLDPDRHHFVAETDSLGFVGELYYRVERRHRRAALDIKLRPEAQGRGLAGAGLRALCELVFAAEPGVDVVWVEPSRENVRARRLYARCGFVPAERPADLPPGESFWELRRPGR
jgi:RimJ/RimL family protein N-acetyltransferase